MALGLISTMPKIALYRAIDGPWQSYWGGVDVLFPKKIPGVALVAALTAPLAVFCEMVKRAFVSDLTFPKDLQRGYRSIFSALWRVPYENGLYFCFKNTFPLLAG